VRRDRSSRIGWRKFLFGFVVGAAAAAAPLPTFEVSGDAVPAREGAASGGGFVLLQGARPVAPHAPEGALCFCGGPLFADDFESGDSGAWSGTLP
jgi:hypothetical protein